MLISRAEAYEILELPIGADPDSIRLNYKRLVQKWHPEKNLKNGGKVSAPEMFDQYRWVFHRKPDSDSENTEEKDSTRSEKRRARKKACNKSSKKEKKRDKKRLENQIGPGNGENHDKQNSDGAESNDEDDVECGGDGEVPVAQVSGEKPVSRETQVLLSRQLAIEGNKHANSGDYKQAVRCFTQAISIDPDDHRFFGNRSYCYDRLQLFERALKDAEKTISLSPNWAKGHFRKGRALAGLKEYSEAERAYLQVLQLDHNCPDALNELVNVRSHQLMEMGFSQQQAVDALRQHGTVLSVIDALLADTVDPHPPPPPAADNDGFTETGQRHSVPAVLKKKAVQAAPAPRLLNKQKTQAPVDIKCDPDNIEGLTALWVGNVLPSVSEKHLHELFSKQGSITSIRMMPDKYCAFINFKTKEDASKALQNLQGVECAGQLLKIKFPDHPITPNTASRKQTNGGTQSSQAHKKVACPDGECYFWRTTGCAYGDRCRFRHVPRNAGIDAGAKK